MAQAALGRGSGLMPAHLREIPKYICLICKGKATVRLYSNDWRTDYYLGEFCRTCGTTCVAQLNKGRTA